ncbi:phosphopantetheine-binding protein [Paracoccus binzhouensis]|uniref:phosphopantetheine-binding protein n=1 Tax=Paracoccus binzhouensis TaxID=2796149 RepID=UPI0018EEE5B3
MRALVPDEDEIAPDENLLFLGLDSLSVLKLVGELRQAGIALSARELLEAPSIEGWWRLIQARRP